MLDKGEEHAVQFIGADFGGEPVQRGGHHGGVELLAVARHQQVASLVDQAHGVKFAGMNRQFGEFFHLANLVHAVRKFAAGGQIGKNDVPCEGKQQFGELVAFTRAPGYMKLHHRKLYSQTLPAGHAPEVAPGKEDCPVRQFSSTGRTIANRPANKANVKGTSKRSERGRL